MSDADRPLERPLERPSGRHPVSIGHLVMGLAFVGLVGVWALVQGGVVDNHDIRWLLPLPWVLAGLAGLLATTLTNRDRWGTRQTGWVGNEAAWQIGWVGSEPPRPRRTEDDDIPNDDPTEEIR